MDIVFATGNKDKVREITQMMKDRTICGESVTVYSMKDKGIDIDIVEDGTTFEENAMIKAKAVFNECKDSIVIADDSGLEIDYINKEPGIYSARYMGENTSYHDKNLNLIGRLRDAKEDQRSARYVCSIAAVLPDGRTLSCVETMEGRIAYEEKGSNGFGFDPIFLIPPYEKTAAEISSEEKHAISHRGKALRHMLQMLEAAY